MADNATAGNGGAPVTFATDEIGSVHYPRTKVGYGSDGSFTDVTESTPLPVLDEHAGSLLHHILKTLLSPFGYDKTLARYRQTAIIESGTVTTVTTVTTASNLVNIDGRNGAMLVNANSRAAWAMSHRSRIT